MHAESVDFAAILPFWRQRGFAESDLEGKTQTFL
jgi:hypothetical protein